jgi:hypothetical protein
MFELGRQQRRQQLLATVGQAFEAALLDKPGIEQDAQVATDAALLALGNQAQIPNAALPRFIEDSQQGQAIRVAKRLSLAAPTDRLLEIEQLRAQPLGFPRLRPTQSWWLVSDG